MTPVRVPLLMGAALIALYAVLPSGLPRDAVYLAVGLGCVAAIVMGVRRHRPAVRAPWYLLAAGLAAWVLGDTIYSWNEDVRHVSPFPSSADVAYLLAYPLLAAGIALLIRRGGRRFDVSSLIDSGIVVVGLGLVSWAWIARPMVENADVPLLERLIAVAYPAGDILLMAMLVRLVAAPGVSSMALRLLAGAVVLQVVADTALAAGMSESWDYASALDGLWLASYVLWGTCALHPQMSEISRRSRARDDLFTVRRVVVLGAAAVLPPLTAGVALAFGHSMDPWVLVGGSIVLTFLVVLRMASGIAEIRLTAQQRDRLQEELLRRASHDPLTGQFNRAYMLRIIQGALRRAGSTGAPTGLIVIDLDDFASVNNAVGPAAADDVLIATARRISDTVGPAHPVGRLGGDQFVVLVEHADAEELTPRIAGALASAMLARHETAHGAVRVIVRIGLTLGLDGSTDASELLHQALIASRRAKLAAAGTFEVFDSNLRREVAERATVEQELRAAIRDGALELRYQPVVSVSAAVVDGYEALVRWHRPNGVLGMPDEFIPIAEKSDLICELGRWVLTEATEQFASWLERDPVRFSPLTVAVNISGRHLADRRIVTDVATALEASGLASHHLVIEVTETVLVDEPRAVIQLDALRALGVTISLDDFGTGYTSIGQLRHLPVDTIKIDRSFLSLTEPGSSELIALMTAAAHACGMLVVAEGVERNEQLMLLKALECDAAQGYLFARPLTSAAVLDGVEPERHPRLRIVRDS
jgi:diguanylate cyclase (GGDEF)-like protein